jgi:hypothetical protein
VIGSADVTATTSAIHVRDLRRVRSEELIAVLLKMGGRVLARPPHGQLLEVRRRLVFVPSTLFVPDLALADALRSAGLSPTRFQELRDPR